MGNEGKALATGRPILAEHPCGIFSPPWCDSFTTTLLSRDVQIVTRADNLELAQGAGLNVENSLEGTAKKAMAKYGTDAKVAFVPYGRYTVFTT